MEIDHTFTGCEQSSRNQLLLQEELSEQNRDLRETRIKSLHEMEELKKVQELRIDEFSKSGRKSGHCLRGYQGSGDVYVSSLLHT